MKNKLRWTVLALFVYLEGQLIIFRSINRSEFPLEAILVPHFTAERHLDDLIQQQVCHKFQNGTTTATIWEQMKPQLHRALQHVRDPNALHGNWTRQLLDLLTPSQLAKAVRAQPDVRFVRQLLLKLARRMHNPDQSPPLKFLVFGGSVVEGTGCRRPPIPSSRLNFESLQECAWPFRLQSLLDHFTTTLFSVNATTSSRESPPWIVLYNLASGGTNSEEAIPILQYWLSPVLEPDGADIIINAYSANDNLPPAFHATTNTTTDQFHFARILKRNMNFVQAARSCNRVGQTIPQDGSAMKCSSFPSSMSDPIVLYVNEYLGNQQESIIGESQLEEAVQFLADYEPTMGYLSVPQSIKHWIWADTSEEFFSPSWIDKKGQSKINVHFGMAGHVVTTISMAYYFLHLVSEFCAETRHKFSPSHHQQQQQQQQQLQYGLIHHPEEFVTIDIPSKEWVLQHKPPYIRPNYTETSVASRIPDKPSQAEMESCLKDMDATLMSKSPPCSFAFLAAPMGTHQSKGPLTDFLKPFTLHQDGWEVQDDYRQGGFQNKLGLVALKPKGKMILRVEAMANQPIRYITVQYLRSYGDPWQGGVVEFRSRVLDKEKIIHEESFRLEGFHDQQVSISYSTRQKLEKEVPVGGTLEFEMELIEGQRFKVGAIMFCRQ